MKKWTVLAIIMIPLVFIPLVIHAIGTRRENDNPSTPQQIEYTPSADTDALWLWPVAGEIIRDFAPDRLVYCPIVLLYTTSYSIRITAPTNTPVYAAEAGRVVRTASNTSFDRISAAAIFGDTVVIYHGNGRYAIYASLGHGTALVEAGDMVAAGQVIGMVGRYDFIEFQVTQDGEPVHPLERLRPE